jgi:ATP-dependent Clp protease ATP-binding subunit ClpA
MFGARPLNRIIQDNVEEIIAKKIISGEIKSETKLTITKEEFEAAITSLNSVDLTKVIEMDDMTALMDQAACASGACEIV